MGGKYCGSVWKGATKYEYTVKPCSFKGDKVVAYGVYEHKVEVITLPSGESMDIGGVSLVGGETYKTLGEAYFQGCYLVAQLNYN